MAASAKRKQSVWLNNYESKHSSFCFVEHSSTVFSETFPVWHFQTVSRECKFSSTSDDGVGGDDVSAAMHQQSRAT